MDFGKKIVYKLMHPWDTFDRWLCTALRGKARLIWSRLWMRKDEKHPSFEVDTEYLKRLTREERYEYVGVIAERSIAARKQKEKRLKKK
jgi:hypothetical protein